MPYGEIRVDTITFTNGGVDKSITVSGLFASTSGNLTVTGTVSGTTANFVSGVFTTQISGATITGTTVAATTGTFTTVTGGTATITSGVFAVASSGAPSITFSGDLDTGIYSPGANQVAITTSGVGRLFVASDGKVGIGTTSPLQPLHVKNAGSTACRLVLENSGSTAAGSTQIYSQNNDLVFDANSSERARIDSSGNMGLGTASPFSYGSNYRSLSISGTNGAVLYFEDTGYEASGDGVGYFLYDGGALSYATASRSGSSTTGTTTRLTIDSSGRLLVGTSSSRASYAANLEIEATTSAATIAVTRNSNDGNPAYLFLAKSRSTSVGGNTIVASGDTIGDISFAGSDGTAPKLVAQIKAQVDGTPGTDDMPGRLVFSTTSDGSATPSPRMTIDSSGRILIATTATPSGATAVIRGGPGGTNAAHLQLTHGTSPFGGGRISVTNTGGDLAFYTHTGDVGGEAYTERLRIGSTGDVGIGAISGTSARLHVRAANSDTIATLLRLEQINAANNDSAYLTVSADAANNVVNYVSTGTSAGSHAFFSATTEIARITTDRISLSSSCLGIDFSGIQTNAAGMTSEILDSYEEGTWTPAYQTSNSDISVTSTTVTHAVYTKIGNRVFCTCRFFSQIASVGTGTVRITGLPFATASSQGDVACVVSFAARFTTAAPVTATLRASATTLDLLTVYTNATSGGTVTYMPAANLRTEASSNIISLAFNYIV